MSFNFRYISLRLPHSVPINSYRYYSSALIPQLTPSVCVLRMCLYEHLDSPQEFGNAGFSRTLLVVYTGMICINALSPLLLHCILARQHTPRGIARWVRKSLLFDVFFDTMHGFLPLGYLAYKSLYLLVTHRAEVCLHATRVGISCHLLQNSAGLQGFAKCAFGGRTPWVTFIKLKSRVLPLILGARKVLSAYKLRYWVAAQRERILSVARKAVTRFERQSGQDNMRGGFLMLRQNGVHEAASELKQSSGPALKRRSTLDRFQSQEYEVRKRAITQLQRARSLRHFYLPVPRWALVAFVVPAVVCCLFVWVRIVTAGRCDRSDEVGVEAPCVVPTFVSQTSRSPPNPR